MSKEKGESEGREDLTAMNEKVREKGGSAMLGDGANENASLTECMRKLLAVPLTDFEEKQELLKNGFCETEMNQAMLLAWSLLKKAAEKGDVSAYREIKALVDTEEDGDGQLDRLLEGIREAIAFEKSRKRKKGPD